MVMDDLQKPNCSPIPTTAGCSSCSSPAWSLHALLQQHDDELQPVKLRGPTPKPRSAACPSKLVKASTPVEKKIVVNGKKAPTGLRGYRLQRWLDQEIEHVKKLQIAKRKYEERDIKTLKQWNMVAFQKCCKAWTKLREERDLRMKAAPMFGDIDIVS